MTPRDAILARIGRALPGDAKNRAKTAAERLSARPKGVIPARGQLPAKERVDLFCRMAEGFAASVVRVASAGDVPAAVTAWLRGRNLPAAVRMGDDPRLAAMGWENEKTLLVNKGPSDGTDEASVTHAFGAIAETGTLALVSGGDNPTTLNFLPENAIVVVDAKDVAGDLETVLDRLRAAFGAGAMPRTLNLVTGPSRSGDIEQTIILGAHGPRALHIVVVE